MILSLIVLVFIAACTEQTQNQESAQTAALEDVEEILNDNTPWQDVILTDVATDQPFSVSEFGGKTVLLESFAVWCPTCTKQQSKLHQLKEVVGENLVVISLDTDPNEDRSTVQNHIELNQFSGLYAISPRSMTQSLIDEFGINVVNAPAAPVILVCEDGTSRLLGRGLKQVEELQEEIALGC